LPDNQQQQDTLAAAIAEVSDKLSALVKDEIELAKAEMTQKAKSMAVGAVALGAGGVIAFFGLVLSFFALGYGMDYIVNNLWIGFLIAAAILVLIALLVSLFAWRKLKVGPPKPTMALDEAQKIRATLTAKSEVRH
jgi:hypothetical protein